MINASDIISSAKNLIGKVNYVFGANNIEGGEGDCSSFTQYLFNKQGVNIGRDTQSQWTNKNLSTISKGELKQGDLVFFKNTYNSNHTDGVSHVGIYIGNNEFIHLSSSKDVTISSLDNSYYSSHYLGAKRVNGVYATSEDSNVINTSFTQLSKKEWLEDNLEVIVRYLFIRKIIICYSLMQKILRGMLITIH